MSETGWGFETRQIHAGQEPDPATGARAVPIYQTTSYVVPRQRPRGQPVRAGRDRQHLHAHHEPDAGRVRGPHRQPRGRHRAPPSASPARWRSSSGQAAETLGILNLAEPGDHLVSSPPLYGGTYNLFHYTLPKLGIEVSFVDDPDDLDQWRAADPAEHQAVLRRDAGQPEERRSSTSRASPAWPTSEGIPLMLDNTVPTPYLIRPFEWGADIVVHSATKFIGGHGTSIGGVHRRRRHVRLRRQRALPELHRARPELPRAGLLAGARPGRLHHQGPRPAAA